MEVTSVRVSSSDTLSPSPSPSPSSSAESYDIRSVEVTSVRVPFSDILSASFSVRLNAEMMSDVLLTLTHGRIMGTVALSVIPLYTCRNEG